MRAFPLSRPLSRPRRRRVRFVRGWSLALTALVTAAWAGTAPMPEVEGARLHWPAVAARTINVHRGDGSYVESLPGDATSWMAPFTGDYYLVAADRGDWRNWPRSETVAVRVGVARGAPAPTLRGDSLIWPTVSAYGINVHRDDGAYVTTLPGDATSWTAPAPGGYYLVATDFFADWPDWPRSGTVIVGRVAPMPTVTGDTLDWPAVPASGINVHHGDGSYVLTLPAGTTSWTAAEPGDYYLVATNDREWPEWPRSVTVMVDRPSSDDPTIGIDDHEEILRNVISLINAEALEAARTRTDEFASGLERMARDVLAGNAPRDGLTLVSDEVVVDSASGGELRSTLQTYACHAGGSMVIVLHQRAGAPVGPRDVRFDGCAIDTDLHDGDLLSTEEQGGIRRDVFDALSVTSLADGSHLSIDGNRREANVLAGGGPDITEVEWTDIDAELPIDSDVTSVTDFRSFRDGYVEVESLSPVIGAVLLPDGSAPLVRVVHVGSARVSVAFTVRAPWSGDHPLTVEAELSHSDSHFDWANPDTAPDYPLADLGSPLTIMGTAGPDDTFSVESLPRDDAAPVQWDQGEIVVVAEDGSRVTLRPAPNDPARVEIRLNGADEPTRRAWSEGFQVRCPENFATGCGR